MIVGERIRLFPTEEQEQQFRNYAGASRFVYNVCLSYKIDVYKNDGYSCNAYDLDRYILELKYSGDYDWLQEIPSMVTKQAVRDLETAYRNYYKRNNGGFPKHKRKGRCKESFYQRNDKFYMYDDCHVKITGIKEPIKIKSHKPIEEARNIRISYDGKYWYLSYSYDVQELPKSDSDEILGVDLGIINLATVSDGRTYMGIKDDLRRLKHLQRALSRKYKQNRGYQKTQNIIRLEKQIRLIWRHIQYKRDTYIHQVTYDLVKVRPGCIVIEDLNVSGMLKNKHLSKAIQRQCFNKFRKYITYKCQAYGVELIVADRFYPSSKKCSCCGSMKKYLSLSDRTYHCDSCDTVIDRDYNASLNLKLYGKDKLTKAS